LPEDVRPTLEAVRAVIHRSVPNATEAISYDIPAMKRNDRYFVSFAGWKRHISLYPIPATDAALDLEIARYKSGKGTLQFPLNEPIPLDLVGKIAGLLADQRAG
jgi:uncharacterized protein YdhG (YjbR/CyaY superfamily)